MSNAVGKVWLVGAGPGDPELITVRGRELLALADVVLFDALSHPALLALCPQAELRNVGKRYGVRSPPQQEITDQIVALAHAGKRVVRLKGGDPLLFARGSEEALALAEAGIPFEIVPGISSPVAVAAYAGIPLTHRTLSSSVTFITGSDREEVEWSDEAWKKLATATDTLCVLMGMRRIEQILEALVRGGRSPESPAAVVQWGARPEQRVLVATVGTLAARVREAGLTNPAIIVVGEVVSLRRELAWFDTQPLFGQRILVPRAVEQAQETAKAVRRRGAEPVLLPTIELHAPPDTERVDAAVGTLGLRDWVVFTSANGVHRSFAAIRRQGRDARAFGAARIAVIGPKTADALRAYGLEADVVASEHVGEGVARAILERGAPGRVLILRALEARDALPNALTAAGAEVEVVPVYETRVVGPSGREALAHAVRERTVDVVAFTSSSTVTSLLAALGTGAVEALAALTVASIGPITSRTARDAGIRVDVEAETYTVDGLLDALEAHAVTSATSRSGANHSPSKLVAAAALK